MIVKLTCQTEGCSSQGKAVEVEDPEELCICGACEKVITDKR